MSPLHDTLEMLSSKSAPWWARAESVVGVFVAFLALLIWFLMSVVANGQARLQSSIDDQAKGQGQQLNLLVQICLNTSQSDRERAQCQAVAR